MSNTSRFLTAPAVALLVAGALVPGRDVAAQAGTYAYPLQGQGQQQQQKDQLDCHNWAVEPFEEVVGRFSSRLRFLGCNRVAGIGLIQRLATGIADRALSNGLVDWFLSRTLPNPNRFRCSITRPPRF